MSPVCGIAASYGINSMLYTNNSSLYYVTENPKESPDPFMPKLDSCVEDRKIWMERNVVKIKDLKTEFIIFCSRVNLSNLSVLSVTLGDCMIPIASSVKDLEVIMDSLLNMDNFVKSKQKVKEM